VDVNESLGQGTILYGTTSPNGGLIFDTLQSSTMGYILEQAVTQSGQSVPKALSKTPNQIAGLVAGWTPDFIEMIEVVPSRRSGAAQFWGRWAT
jgi:hypothetical protein